MCVVISEVLINTAVMNNSANVKIINCILNMTKNEFQDFSNYIDYLIHPSIPKPSLFTLFKNIKLIYNYLAVFALLSKSNP